MIPPPSLMLLEPLRLGFFIDPRRESGGFGLDRQVIDLRAPGPFVPNLCQISNFLAMP